jgi:2-oxoglutarate ferredoxin oxidoreductase subunit gamma
MDQIRREARRELEDRYEIRLAGEGGQGMILAGVILAEAAVHDGLNVVQTQDYGPEARGGASCSEVIIAHGEIDYPKLMSPDFLLCMSQEACDKFFDDIGEDGLIVVDSDNVSRLPSHRAVEIPISHIAESVTGRRIAASIVGLGVLAGITDVVTLEALQKAVSDRVPAGTEEMNLQALAAGFAEARRLQADAGDQA